MAPIGLDDTPLIGELLSAANETGGWAYYRGKASRLEPTAWALLTLRRGDGHSVDTSKHRAFIEGCQQSSGWLVENAAWPVNIGFNALLAFVLLNLPDSMSRDRLLQLVGVLVNTKGVKVPPSPSFAQDNSLQGWSWNLDTFSWVEPTAWATLVLKKAVRAGLISSEVAEPRINEAERLLIDRCCHDGGWNFGNANVMGRDLYPHVPTTALALMALQNRRGDPAVVRSLSFLEAQWSKEESLYALGLSLICLSLFGLDSTTAQERLQQHLTAPSGERRSQVHTVLPAGSIHGLAVALYALFSRNDEAFRV
jgi:hypothetical protein